MFGVYKAYKEGAPDSKYQWVFDTEAEAKQAVAYMENLRLNENRKDTLWVYSDGWEFRGAWTYEKIDHKPITFDAFKTEVEQVLAENEEEFGPWQGEGDADGEEA